jgi:hypothetical protein
MYAAAISLEARMKIGIGFGVGSILIGIALMMGGQQLCRTSCWVDNLFKVFLPRDLESLAGGMPWIAMGVVLVLCDVWRRPRP